MAIKELITRFGFEIDDHGLKELSEGIEAIKEGVLHLGELLIGEAVGLYELVEHAAEAGVKLKIMTQQTGLAAERLQELQFRAKLADVSADELNLSMTFLARNMNEAANGSEQARKHFRQFGISVADLKSGALTTDVVLERMSDRFSKMADGPKKTGLALEIFGRSGARMVPFLNALHHELDPINKQIMEMSMVTDHQIEESEEFHITLETLKTALTGIVRVVGFGLMPVAREVIEAMKKWIVQNRQLVVQNLTAFVRGMAAALKITIKIVDALVQSLSGLAAGFGGVETSVKLLLGAFAVLSGATVLFGIGKVIEAVVALGNSFAIANLKAALIPIAIGAAIVAILLIMEDIYSAFNGKDSFFGDLLKAIPEIGKAFEGIFAPIFGPIANIINALTSDFTSWTSIFKELGVLLVNVLLSPLRAVASISAAIVSVIGRIAGTDRFKDVIDGLNSASDMMKMDSRLNPDKPEGGKGFKGLPANSLNPNRSPEDRQLGAYEDYLGGVGSQIAARPQSPAGPVNQNKIDLKQEFNFPAGTDPANVAPKITDHTTSGLDDLLRQTNRSTSNGGAY